MKDTKILLVGDDGYEMYVKAFYNRFIEMGYKNVELFATNQYMKSNGKFDNLLLKIENKAACGNRVNRVNKKLLQVVEKMVPKLVFLYSARIVYASTIKKIKSMGSKVFVYNNDDPFADYYPKYYWRHYRKSLKYADAGFVYRLKNVKEYKNSGCHRVELLRSYYIKERNFYMENPQIQVPGVVFIGHRENDERQEYIKALLDEKIRIGVPAVGWEDFEPDNEYLIRMKDSLNRYNEILNAAKIAIVFLSKINHDTYTRRCFEIPATRTMMLSVYTEDMATMFEADKEAVYFTSKEEFVEKTKYYLEHEQQRKQIGLAGYERLMRDGHEVEDRIRQILQVFSGEEYAEE